MEAIVDNLQYPTVEPISIDIHVLQKDVAELKSRMEELNKIMEVDKAIGGPFKMLENVVDLCEDHKRWHNNYYKQCDETKKVKDELEALQSDHKELKDSGVMLLDEIDKKKEEIEELKKIIQEREDTIRRQSKKIGEQHKELLKLLTWQKTFRNLMRDGEEESVEEEEEREEYERPYRADSAFMSWEYSAPCSEDSEDG